MRSCSATIAAACAAFAGLAGLAPLATASAASVAAGSVVPDQDPFYTAPANIGSYAPGQVLASRPVSASTFGGPLTVSAWQISYRTNNSHDNAELAVTTLVVPNTPWFGGGRRPAVSVEAAEDSDGTQCAPSYEIASSTDFADPAQAASLLAAGYAVAIPDHEGPNSVFLAGPQEGHAVLDGIRAVKNFDHGGIGAANHWALDGYSGGANAAGWAAQLQPSYAPDVALVGAAIGGTPAAPAAVAQYLDGGFASGLEFAAAASIATEWPESGIAGLLNAAGVAAFNEIKGQCAAQIVPEFAFKRLADYATVPDPLDVPSVKAILDLDTLGATAPTTPIYDYHATSDELVPVSQDDTLVTAWCSQGAAVDAVRDPGEHGTEAVLRYPSVQDWLTDRFRGKQAPNSC